MPPARRVARVPSPGKGLNAEDMGTWKGILGCIEDLDNLLRCYMIFFRNEGVDTKITHKNVGNARFLLSHHLAVRAFHKQHIEWVTAGPQNDPFLLQIQEGMLEKLQEVDSLALDVGNALARYDWLLRMPWMFGGLVAAVAAPWTGPLAPVLGLQLAAAAREIIDAIL